MAGGATVGSSRAFRLDPHTLPVRGSARPGGTAEAAFVIDRENAIVHWRGIAGASTAETVPLVSYRGVAVRMETMGDNGAIRVLVELLHKDTWLTLPLVVADDPEDVADDWQAWGQALNLPLLIIGQDGSVSGPLTQIGGLVATIAKPRRRHSFFAGRRPRFLTRRKTGHSRSTEQLAGREIIARN